MDLCQRPFLTSSPPEGEGFQSQLAPRCQFAVHRPGSPSPPCWLAGRNHGMPCRGSCWVAQMPAWLSQTYSIVSSYGRRKRFPPRLKAGHPAAILVIVEPVTSASPRRPAGQSSRVTGSATHPWNGVWMADRTESVLKLVRRNMVVETKQGETARRLPTATTTPTTVNGVGSAVHVLRWEITAVSVLPGGLFHVDGRSGVAVEARSARQLLVITEAPGRRVCQVRRPGERRSFGTQDNPRSAGDLAIAGYASGTSGLPACRVD